MVGTGEKKRRRRAYGSLSEFIDQDRIAGPLFILPFIIGLLVFTVYPFFSSLYYAFTDFQIGNPIKWLGFSNFIRMFSGTDDKFWISFFVTFKFAFVQVPMKLAFSLLVAIVLSRKSKAIGAYRSIFYIPSLMGGSVAVALMWKRLFGYDGAINSILSMLGVEAIPFLTSPKYALWTLTGLGVWQFGSAMLIFLAAIKSVPASYHEAAIVDGAGPVRRFFSITFPMLTPVLFFNLINQLIGSFQTFNSSYLITNGGDPLNSTLYYAVHLYTESFTYWRMGYGCAMAWFLLIIIGIFTSLIFKSSDAWVYYESER